MTLSPKPQKQSRTQHTKKTNKSNIGLVLVGVFVFVLVAGSFLTGLSNNYYNTQNSSVPSTDAGGGAVIAKADTLSENEMARRQQEFANFAKEGLQVSILPVEQAVQAIHDSQTFPNEHKAQVIADVATGKNQVVEITVWDDVAEDGDVVSVSSGFIGQEIPIFHQPTKVVLPLVTGRPITLTGVKDGGGGITVAIANGNTALANPVMREGETITIPIK